ETRKEVEINGNTYLLTRKGILEKNETAEKVKTVAAEIEVAGALHKDELQRDTVKVEDIAVKRYKFEDLVIADTKDDESWMIEVGGEATERQGNVNIIPDYVMFPHDNMSLNWIDKGINDIEFSSSDAPVFMDDDEGMYRETDILFNSDFDPSVVRN